MGKRMLGRLKTGQGFSLIEVLVVVAIIGALVLIAVPNYIIWNQKYQLRSEVSNLAGNLGRARMMAINTNTVVTATVTQTAAAVPVTVTFSGGVLPTITMNRVVSLSDVTGNRVGQALVASPQVVGFNQMGLWVNTGFAANTCLNPTAPATPCPAGSAAQVLNFVNPNAVNYRIVILPTGKIAWCYTSDCVN
jgi:prepilin-type N-terminal cleavage/methylation domain-containing protein